MSTVHIPMPEYQALQRVAKVAQRAMSDLGQQAFWDELHAALENLHAQVDKLGIAPKKR